MTQSVTAQTQVKDSAAAGRELSEQIAAGLDGSPDALIVFASSQHDYPVLLKALQTGCRPRALVGCSSAGEFTSEVPREQSACALALKSSEMAFAVGVGRGLASDRRAAAQEIVSTFRGLSGHEYVYHTALVLTDALAGHADELVEELTLLTEGAYQLVGGGAGDDANFHRTHVFHGDEATPDAAVALEILSNKPVGVGVHHGWAPATPGMRVTAADGMRLISLNASPAIEAFESFAAQSGQTLDKTAPLPFFLHNVLGINTGADYRLRVPLQVCDDGSVLCAAEVPVGATVHIMNTAQASAASAAKQAVAAAVDQLGDSAPSAALFFDCVATRLRAGSEFGMELTALQSALAPAPFVGCNTYGQIARADGQFGGFHNCTAVVCVLPD